MRKSLALVAAAVLGLTACGGGGGSDAPPGPVPKHETLDSLVAAAEEEGRVRLYTSLTEGDLDAMVEGFENTYDIDVQALRMGTGDVLNRFDSETQAKAGTADALIISEARYFGAAGDDGRITPLSETGVLDLLPDYPQEMVLDEFNTAVAQIVSSGFAYNTELVRPDELPRTWEDLLDPRWADKLLATPPESSLNMLNTYGQVMDEYGIEMLERLTATQIARTYPNLVPMHEALAAGEGEIALQSAKFFVEKQQSDGVPIEFFEVAPAIHPTVTPGVAAAARNPNAARLLVHFLLSKEGNHTVTDAQAGAISPYDTDLIPEGFEPVPEEQIARYVEQKQEIVNAMK